MAIEEHRRILLVPIKNNFKLLVKQINCLKINTLKQISLLALVILLASCNTGNKVASSFGKRKYTKGYFLNSVANRNPEQSVIAAHSVSENRNEINKGKITHNSTPVLLNDSAVTDKTAVLASTSKIRLPVQEEKINLLYLTHLLRPGEISKGNIVGYPQPNPGYGVPGHGGTSGGGSNCDKDAKTGLALSLIGVGLGVAVFAFASESIFLFALASVICACFGLGLSIAGLKSQDNKAEAIAGLVLSIITIAFWLLIILVVIALLGGGI